MGFQHWARIAGAAALLAAGLGCDAILGIADKEPRPASGSCHTGLDADGNLVADCADPQCSEFACAPPVPAGWLGPVRLSVGGDEATCLPGEVELARGSLTQIEALPALCTACQCGATEDACFVVAQLFDQSGYGCYSGVSPTTTNIVAPGSCQPLTMPVIDAAWVVGAWPTATGHCQPSGGELTLPLPELPAADGRVCQGPSGWGCGPGHHCVPTSAPPHSGPCLWREGDRPCPEGDYSVRRVLETVVSDDRGCTPCECQAPLGVSCTTGLVNLHEQAACSGDTESVSFNGMCKSTSAITSVGSVDVTLSAPGTCQPAGGIGTSALNVAVGTLCCLP